MYEQDSGVIDAGRASLAAVRDGRSDPKSAYKQLIDAHLFAMAEFDPTAHSHRRCMLPIIFDSRDNILIILFSPVNPLTEEYILVSPHRARRPWLGQVEPPQPPSRPQYDPGCYLCPGNKRAGGDQNEVYTSIYTFPNDYAALTDDPVSAPPKPSHPLLSTRVTHGRCDVVIFHPRHDLTLAQLKPSEILPIIKEWIRIYEERSLSDRIRYVQIFEV